MISRPMQQEGLAPEPSEDLGKEMSPSPGVRALDAVREHQVLQDAGAPGNKRLKCYPLRIIFRETLEVWQPQRIK